MAKILIVDDELTLAESVRRWLYAEGHTVKAVHCGADALNELSRASYDIVLLDLMLPDISGIDVCQRYRSANGNARVLMITAQGLTENKELGFESGADDYIVKPFDLKELSVRVRALMRRSITLNDGDLTVDDITLKPDTMQVFRSGKEIKLLPQEFALLQFLMNERNNLFNADTLRQRVWHGNGTPETIRTHIKNLRRKIDKGFKKQFIRTIYGVGYGFTDL